MSRRRCSLRESRHLSLPRGSACPACCCSSASGWRSARRARGWIDFGPTRDYELARTIGVVALALILFEGGLTAGFEEIRPVLRPSLVARDRRHARHLRAVRLRGVLAVRLLDARGDAARRDHLVHRRRGDLRAPARVDAPPPAGAHARGRGRLQRPGRRPARDRLHRVDPAARLRRARHGSCCSCARWGSARSSGSRVGSAGGPRAPPHAAREPGPVPGRDAVDGGPRVRRGGHAARLRLPRRVPRRPGARLGPHPGEADGDGLPRGARVGRADRDVPRARPARLPERARRRVARGHRARADPRVRRAAAARVPGDRVRPLHRGRARRARAGRGCAAPCRWCSRPSR